MDFRSMNKNTLRVIFNLCIVMNQTWKSSDFFEERENDNLRRNKDIFKIYFHSTGSPDKPK